MERGSDKHSPRIDDDLKQEVEPLLRGGQAPHVEDFREVEPLGDYRGTAPTEDASLEDRDELPAPVPGEGPLTSGAIPPSAAAPDPGVVQQLQAEAEGQSRDDDDRV